MNSSKIKNSESNGLITGIILILMSFFLWVIPLLFSLDMMQWGYGIICIGLFIFIMGGVTFLMYLSRYLILRSILRGENVIVHWVYSKDKMLEQAKVELEKAKSENKLKLGAVWFFFILFTGIFLFIGFTSGEGDSMGMFFGIMLFVALIISAVALIMPGIMYRNSTKASPDAIIATNGLYYLGQLHSWNKTLSLIDKLEIDEAKKELEFTFKYITKLGWFKYESYSIKIPIPEGQIEKAKEVLNKLG